MLISLKELHLTKEVITNTLALSGLELREPNFDWLVDHGRELAKEYTRRYGKIHSSHKVIAWCADNADKLEFPEEGLTEFGVAISDDQNCRMLIPNFDEPRCRG